MLDEPNKRLRHAREKAGFETARAAAKRFAWNESTYAAHENGQNGFSCALAEEYAKSFKVRPGWLAFNEGGQECEENQKIDVNRAREVATAIFGLLRTDLDKSRIDALAEVFRELLLEPLDPQIPAHEQLRFLARLPLKPFSPKD